MAFEDDWKDLDAQKQSIFLIFNSKYLKAITPIGEEFMIIYGENRYHYKCMLMDMSRKNMYYRINQSHDENISICKSVLMDMLKMDIPSVMKKYDFEYIQVMKEEEK